MEQMFMEIYSEKRCCAKNAKKGSKQNKISNLMEIYSEKRCFAKNAKKGKQ